MGPQPADSNGLSGSRHRVRGAICLLLIAVSAAIAGGILYQNWSLARERRAYPRPGRMVDVDGRKMHLYCTGHGTPVVILDSGLGGSYMAWQRVQPKIATFVQVCSYDRAGMGYSDPSSRPRTSSVFAEELHQLLHHAGLPAPYLLVGHSMAGFNIRIFAALYPSEVAGMVLVDASHPNLLQRFPRAQRVMSQSWIRKGELLEYAAPIGIPRLLGYCGNNVALRATECNFNSFRETASERRTFQESAAQTAAIAGNLGDLPLIVLSRDTRSSELNQMQEELRGLSTRGIRVVAKGSGHAIQHDRPDVVVQAVHEIVNQVSGSDGL